MFVKAYNVYEVPLASLNSAGSDGSEGNVSKLKKIAGRVYVSGQAYRYYLRQTLETIKKNKEWVYDTVNREREVVIEEGRGKNKTIRIDVEKLKNYPGLDVFGYMITEKGDSGAKRRSVLNNSVMLSVLPFVVRDLTRKRVLNEEDKSTSFSFTEATMNVFYNVVEVDVDRLGVFTNEELGLDGVRSEVAHEFDDDYRKAVIDDVVRAMLSLRGGAKQSRFLAELQPPVSFIAVTESIRVPVNLQPRRSEKIAVIDDRIVNYFKKHYGAGNFVAVVDSSLDDSRLVKVEASLDGVEVFDVGEEDKVAEWVLERLF